MPRPRSPQNRPLSATERVRRFRAQRAERRLEVLLDLTTFDQVARFAERLGCSRQEVLKMAFRSCLPVLRKARSPQELFNRVRDALEAAESRNVSGSD